MARLTREQMSLVLSGFGAGLATGGAAGYFLVQQRMRLKYAQIADDEIQEVKAHYREKEMELVAFQEKIARAPKPNLDAVMEDLGYKSPDDEKPEEPEEEVDGELVEEPQSRWEHRDLWDYDRELAERTKEFPYVIHSEEFDQMEEYHQVTFTYFEGDQILVDEKDEVIPNMDQVVGLANLDKFGHGSKDPNVVYVRNDKLGMDYEILLHKSHYAKEILGIEEEPLEHSAHPRRRMRFDDDG